MSLILLKCNHKGFIKNIANKDSKLNYVCSNCGEYFIWLADDIKEQM